MMRPKASPMMQTLGIVPQNLKRQHQTRKLRLDLVQQREGHPIGLVTLPHTEENTHETHTQTQSSNKEKDSPVHT